MTSNTKNYTRLTFTTNSTDNLATYCQNKHKVILGNREIISTWDVPNAQSMQAEFQQEDIDDLDEYTRQKINEFLQNDVQIKPTQVKGWLVVFNRYVNDGNDLLIYPYQFLAINQEIAGDDLVKKIPAYHNKPFDCECEELFINHDEHFLLGKQTTLTLFLKSVHETLLFTFLPVSNAMLQDKPMQKLYDDLLNASAFQNVA